jgi:hypothetical protein
MSSALGPGQRGSQRPEHGGGIIEIAAIGFQRVLGRAALGTHHFKECFGIGGAEIAHEQTGSCQLLSFSVGTRTCDFPVDRLDIDNQGEHGAIGQAHEHGTEKKKSKQGRHEHSGEQVMEVLCGSERSVSSLNDKAGCA